jgi:hypothetical protein
MPDTGSSNVDSSTAAGHTASEAPGPSRIPGWVQGVTIIGALLMAAGAVIALLNPAILVAPGAEVNEAVRLYAGYLFSRNLALAGTLLFFLFRRAPAALSVLLALNGIIQLLDVCMDAREHRWSVLPGVLVLAVLFIAAAIQLRRARRSHVADTP